MSPEMLTQPFEQSLPAFYPQYNSLFETEQQALYYMGYPPMESNEDFRSSFFNPFEIKHRRRTSRAQLKVLEKSFEENPKPNASIRRILAQQLDMTPRGVQIWFQNRRAKAKLQKRKSSEEQEQQDTLYDPLQVHNNARMVAATAAAACLTENAPELKIDGWLSMPIHPLAPVIEDSTDCIQFDDWRRMSCPALGFSIQEKDNTVNQPLQFFPTCAVDTRRMTADNISLHPSFFMPMNTECDTQTWANSDIYSGLNYSPLSQQLTPMLSTGSPVSSVDGAYYDSCLDLFISTAGSASS